MLLFSDLNVGQVLGILKDSYFPILVQYCPKGSQKRQFTQMMEAAEQLHGQHSVIAARLNEVIHCSFASSNCPTTLIIYLSISSLQQTNGRFGVYKTVHMK